jgi:tyrosinase
MDHGMDRAAHRIGFTLFDFPSATIAKELRRSRKVASVAPLPPKVLKLRKDLLSGKLTPDALKDKLIVRRDQKTFRQTDKSNFKKGVQKMAVDKSYGDLVKIHAEMKHTMHGSMGKLGVLRFLPWHRRYVIEFERLLIAADKALRPGAVDPISLPYWHWADPFPAWLEGFLPANSPETGSPLPPRTEREPPSKPVQSDINYILKSFRNQKQWFDVDDDYALFTFGLEGWGKRADGSSLPAHNHVHDWVGGIMSDTSFSPVDPVFWLHHAEVDRLWHVWQIDHAAAHPNLTGKSAKMDPWTETYQQLQAIETLGYTYA